MIELNETYNTRWKVVAPFPAAYAQNFALFLVEDRAVDDRRALLKTVRTTDLPDEALLRNRRGMLTAEATHASSLIHPALPEPLDSFVLPDDELAIVYSRVGPSKKDYSLREKLLRFGFFVGTQQGTVRAVDKIAQFMSALLRFTQVLWEAGFVHSNLCHDHLFYLQDGVLRVTGQSAICQRTGPGGTEIRASDPGLRNLTAGYQSSTHRKNMVRGTTDPLEAARVRWFTFAALTLDLIWGRDLREYCVANNHGTLSGEARAAVQGQIKKDFPLARQFWEIGREGHSPLTQLFELVWQCLDERTAVAENMFPALLGALADLDTPSVSRGLRIHLSEDEWREERINAYRRPRIDDREEVVILGNEQAAGRRPGDVGVIAPTTYQVHRVLSPWHTMATLRTDSSRLYLPGEVVTVRHTGTTGLAVAGWSALRPSALRPSTVVRALSLGWVHRAVHTRGRAWALVDMDGVPRPIVVRSRGDRQKYVVFPRAGRFFRAEVTSDGTGLVPLECPQIEVGRTGLVPVREVGMGMAFLDFPVGLDHFVTCVLPQTIWGVYPKVVEGAHVPVRIAAVSDEVITLAWEYDLLDETAKVDMIYDARVTALRGLDIEVAFGDTDQFRGHVHSGSIPWGLPIWDWANEPNARHPIRVRSVVPRRDQGALEYSVDFAGPWVARSIEQVFRSASELTGVVVGYATTGVLLRVETQDTFGRVQVRGLIPVRYLPRAVEPSRQYPLGSTHRVRIADVDPSRRSLYLAPR